MIRALVGKELRQLRPLIGALVALEVLSVLQELLRRAPDEATWAELSFMLTPEDGGAVAVVQLCLAFVAAYMLFPREHDQRSIEFLYALPVRRGVIFASKFCTALGVLWIFNVVDYGAGWWLQSFNHSSISGQQFNWSLWGAELGLISVYTYIGLSYGMLLSFLRRFGAMLALLIWIAVSVMGELDPSLVSLNVLSLLRFEYRGSEPIVAGGAWVFHAGFATWALLVSARLWLDRGEGFTGFNARILQTGVSRFLTAAAAALGLAALVAIGFVISEGIGADEEDAGDTSVSQLETEIFRFSFFPVDRRHAVALSVEADSLFAEVTELLGASVSPPVIADLTDSSSEHLGIAGWKKVRLERGVLEDPALRRYVLVHETTHVVASVESNRRLAEHHAEGQFFVEGIADWVSFQVLDMDDQRLAMRTLAAAAWRRFNLRFEDLTNRAAFIERYDESLVYPIGESWLAALARSCGRDAPGRLLRSIGATDAPTGLSGGGFWSDRLQAMECDLEAVNARHGLLLKEFAGRAAQIPRASGVLVSQQNDRLEFEVWLHDADPEREYEVMLRVRDGVDAGAAGNAGAVGRTTGGERVSLSVPAGAVSGERFQFQVGVETQANERPFYERWQDASVFE